jgi:hypothetical protein
MGAGKSITMGLASCLLPGVEASLPGTLSCGSYRIRETGEQ